MSDQLKITASRALFSAILSAGLRDGEGGMALDQAIRLALSRKTANVSVTLANQAMGDAFLEGFLKAEWRDPTIAIRYGTFFKRIRARLRKSPLSNNNNNNPAGPISLAARREAEAVVRSTMADLMETIRSSCYADRLPANWAPSVKMDWSENRSRSRGGAGGKGLYEDGGLSLAMRRRVPADGVGVGPFEFIEYASIARRSDIGTLKSDDWRDCLRALVAHELAHAVQRSIERTARKAKAPSDPSLRKPHGVGWQRIYALLREACFSAKAKVVPLRPAKAVLPPEPLRLAASAPTESVRDVARPTGTPVQLRLF
jgi:hypothetical protein